MATRWGHPPPACHGPPLCARRPAGWPGGVEWCHAPGMCGRRFRSRAYRRRDPSGAPKGQQQGEGHTSMVAARAPGPLLRVVCPPRARRRRHGDLPGQGAGHLPCRVSRQVPRCHVATGDAVGTAAASPAPRPASALRRLLVLIPSAGREESSGGKSLKTRVDMTSNVKSWLPILWHVLRPFVLRASEEAEPGRDDG